MNPKVGGLIPGPDVGACLEKTLNLKPLVPKILDCLHYLLICVLICIFRLYDCLNPFPHSTHRYGLSPECVRWCLFKRLALRKLLSHSLQEYGLNFLPQWGHWKGLSPECVSSCLIRVALYTKLLSHCEQLKTFSLVWQRSCFFMLRSLLKLLPQKEHMKGMSSEWIFMWLSRPPL
uniref:Uncharacterized protein n=1 Tax=Anabas testudineus TaxID=64144 RepID=A0AAQ6IKT2_ANATE